MYLKSIIRQQIFVFIILNNIQNIFSEAKYDFKQLKCLVCQAAMEEIDNEISKIDSSQRVEVGSYRLDASGNMHRKTVPITQSEVRLSEILDTICEKFENYARATWKSNGELTIIPLMTHDGMMNPDMSKVDLITDSDLNKSLTFYCEGIIEDNEDSIIKHYVKKSNNIDIRVCSQEAKLCSHSLPDEEDNDHEHTLDEL